MSAISTPGNTGDRAYSHQPVFETKTCTILEAIDLTSRGLLTPFEVYRQMPEAMQKEIDSLAKTGFNRLFSLLSIKDQSAVFLMFKRKIESYQQIESVVKNDSPLEAFTLAIMMQITLSVPNIAIIGNPNIIKHNGIVKTI